MDLYARTTVRIPKMLLRDAQLYAVNYGTTLTELIKEGLESRLSHSRPTKRSLLSLSGTLDGHGQEPPTRSALYDEMMDERT